MTHYLKAIEKDSTPSTQIEKIMSSIGQALEPLDHIEDNDEVYEDYEEYERINSNVYIVSFPSETASAFNEDI